MTEGRHRRKTERTHTRVKALVTATDSGKSFTGFTRDISRQGLFIEARIPLPPGTPLRIELDYPDGPIELEGTVVRAEKVPVQLQAALKSGMGVQLKQTDAVARAAGKKRNPRLPIGSDVVVFFGSERHRLKLHDLSATGAAFLSPRELPEMGFARLHFKLPPAAEVVEVEGVAVDTRPIDDETLIAINFIDPPPSFVQRVEALIHERDGGEEE